MLISSFSKHNFSSADFGPTVTDLQIFSSTRDQEAPVVIVCYPSRVKFFVIDILILVIYYVFIWFSILSSPHLIDVLYLYIVFLVFFLFFFSFLYMFMTIPPD